MKASEMQGYRKMMKIKWIDKVTNEEVLEMVQEERSLHKMIKEVRDRPDFHNLKWPMRYSDNKIKNIINACKNQYLGFFCGSNSKY